MANGTAPSPNDPLKTWSPYLIALALAILLFMMFYPLGTMRQAISYSEFRALVADNQVAEVRLRDHEIWGRLRRAQPIGEQQAPRDSFVTHVPSIGDPELLPLLQRHRVVLRTDPGAGIDWVMVLSILPWIFLLVIVWAFVRASRLVGGGLGRGGELDRFLGKAVQRAETPKATFADVAGQDNAKREVQELVDYLRDPDRFRKLGADVPHGVLLMGPPGTGKTLLARALAGEAGVPFFSISGSEFIEVFVGVGASRVRNLFAAAKKNSPCIIFIDELDAVGRTRGTGLGGGHDEREQTLNQILAQMDGFEPHEAIIVLAATNRPDVLDPALLRPGRFDRHVTLDLPDHKDRVAILKVHIRKVPLAADIDLARLGSATPGFSGADLRNLVNEAAILAARADRKEVIMQDFDEARDKVILGSARSLVIQPDERHRLAVHEAGHAIVSYFLPHTDPLYKVSIIPRGRTLGGTQQLPERERHTLPEEYLNDRLAVMLAGRTAERELLGSVSSGADDDIRQATALARAMVARWGMSPDVGPIDLRDSDEHPFLGREMAQPRRFSESSAELVDKAVQHLLGNAEARASELLHTRRPQLQKMIEALEAEETLERDRIGALLGPRAADAGSTARLQAKR